MKIMKPSEEAREAERLKREHPDDYISDSYTDSSNRGGPLGAEDSMPDGGDSTRGMSQGPASKSPPPTKNSNPPNIHPERLEKEIASDEASELPPGYGEEGREPQKDEKKAG